jgi:hypothetical protein
MGRLANLGKSAMFPLPELHPAVYGQDSAFHDHMHEPGFIPQQVQDQSGLDPNSPEVFKQSLHIVHDHVVRAQNLARNVIAMMSVISSDYRCLRFIQPQPQSLDRALITRGVIQIK